MNGNARSHFPREGWLHFETRRGSVRLICACERVFLAEIQLAIDIDASPGALEELTDEGLQRFNCPRCDQIFDIAEPILLHHREGRRLALFVPSHVGHRALVFNAELAAQLAAADPATLPAYGSQIELLVGVQNLRGWLFGPKARSRAPLPPEDELATDHQAAPEPSPSPAPAMQDQPSGAPIHEAFADLVHSDSRLVSVVPGTPEIDDVDEDEPMFSDDWLGRDTLNPAAAPTAPAPRAEAVSESTKRAGSSITEAAVDFAELLEDDEENDDIDEEPVEEEDDVAALDEEILTVDDDEADDIVVERPGAAEAVGKGPAMVQAAGAPAAILEGAERCSELLDGQVVFFHRVAASRVALFDPSTADLWFQLLDVASTPLLTATMVSDPTMDRPHFLTWPLEPRHGKDQEIIHALRRSYRAEVRLFDEQRREVARIDLSADRELNVSVVLERAARALAAADPSAADPSAAVAALAASSRPFGEPLPELFTAYGLPAMDSFEQTRAVLEQLAPWLEPERHDHLVLVRSFPLDYLEEIVVEVIDRCVRYGVRLPERLKDRAITLGHAANRAELIRHLVAAFDRVLAAGEGPPEETAARNWRALLSDSAEVDVIWDPQVQDRAEELLEAHGLLDEATLRDAQAALAEPDGLETGQLLRMLRHRRLRAGAIAALCRRAEPAGWKEAVRALERLDAAAILEAVRAVAGLREAVAGEITGLLTAEHAHVRQAAAVLLCELALRRTLMPILKALGAERTPIWPEFARAIAATGSAAVRSLERQLSDEGFPLERLALAVRLLEQASPRASARFEAMAESGDERAARLMELARLASIEPSRVSPAERYGDLLRRAAGQEAIAASEAALLVDAYRAAMDR